MSKGFWLNLKPLVKERTAVHIEKYIGKAQPQMADRRRLEMASR